MLGLGLGLELLYTLVLGLELYPLQAQQPSPFGHTKVLCVSGWRRIDGETCAPVVVWTAQPHDPAGVRIQYHI